MDLSDRAPFHHGHSHLGLGLGSPSAAGRFSTVWYLPKSLGQDDEREDGFEEVSMNKGGESTKNLARFDECC